MRTFKNQKFTKIVLGFSNNTRRFTQPYYLDVDNPFTTKHSMFGAQSLHKPRIFFNYAVFVTFEPHKYCNWLLANIYKVLKKIGPLVINHIIVASIDVWQSYFAHTFCKIHFTLFFSPRKFTFFAIYAVFWAK